VVFPLSSVSSMSSVSDDESPIFKRKRRTEVQFVDLHTVATSSVSSPIQDVLKTPQFQLRKMRKQMALERNMRDDLELELAASCKIITEKETQLCLLQQRLQRLVRQNDEQEPKELEELRDKNERNGKEDQVQKTLDQPLEGRWNYIANFLQSQCKYNPDLGTIVSWQNILNGKSLDVELSKVKYQTTKTGFSCVPNYN
ncbi:Nuclear mitotic apparatus protein 1, partial [Acipenser ruthenus]